jgi:putative aminopeptidase FrvX
MTRRLAILLLISLSLFQLRAELHAQVAERLLKDVTGIANAPGNPERRAEITTILESDGLKYRLEEFVDRRMRTGTNIVVTVPGGSAETIVVGAHYDRVGVGQGALDNGASCAVLLELLRVFKAKPLAKHTLRVVFFDLEEGGLSGSQAHFLGSAAEMKPRYGINLDIFAFGNALFAVTSLAEGELSGALTKAAMDASIPLKLFPPAQYPASDHRSMILAGIETVGISLMGASDIDQIHGLITGQSAEVPTLLATIHSPNDTLDTVKPGEIEKALPVLESFLRSIDEK